MFENLKDKKLLVIGSGEADAEIVKSAKEMGVYTIAVDGIPKSLSTFAKNIADESWDINYSHYDEIVNKCLETGVDGVIAGYSEPRMLAGIQIAKRLNKPFYVDEDAFEITRDKSKFKDACTKYGILVPSYITVNEVPDNIDDLMLPALVKSVDGAGRKGMTFCFEKDQLKPAIEKALDCSLSHQAIIEEYIDGTEYTAIYVMGDDTISLCILKDKFLVQECRNLCFANFIIAPSVHLNEFMDTTDLKMQAMLRGIGATKGTICIQGIYNEKGFYVFEANYRLGGGNDQRITEKENGTNYVKMMISHALTGEYGNDIKSINPWYKHCTCSLRLYVKEGMIEKMKYPAVGELPEISSVIAHRKEGIYVQGDGTTGQRVLTYFMSGDTVDDLIRAIDYIHEHTIVEDPEGNRMLYENFDTDVLKSDY